MRTKSSNVYFQKRSRKASFSKAYAESDFLVKVGVSIAKAREQAGYSQAQLGKLLKTTQSVISRIENGNQNLSLNMLSGIARVLKCRFEIQMNNDRLAA